MRAAQDYELGGTYEQISSYAVPEGVGWITFATVMLALAAVWNFVEGLLAISSSRVYAADAVYVFSDLNTWGWIVLVLGIAQGLASIAIVSGNEFARWFGIVSAGANAIGQLMFVPIQPWWAITMFAVDVMIIYALAVYGGRRLRPAV
jgi:hypothetical protein